MNTHKKSFGKLIICIAVMGFVFNWSQAQIMQLENKNSSMTVFGTSNVHGWKVEAEKQNGAIKFANLDSCEIEHLSLAVFTESLKGVKPAITSAVSQSLKSDQYKSILFTLSEVSQVVDKGNGLFELQTIGELVIAGTKREIPLNFNVTVVGSQVKLEGMTQLKMSDFNITPPEGLLGTVQAKDEIFLKFDSIFMQSSFI
ncbi:YceI family protein [Algibacter mikhailovii]|uniref:YceI family protein n=1 Tax=Algibacter mikhailovii TaxID=425498 RepID=UPI002493D8B8|nr:YceI family protein [Algibacter mikhailovii]